MPSENEVLETKNKRLQVLNIIYHLTKQGSHNISDSEITNYTNIKSLELYNILDFLIKEDWIKQTSSIKRLLDSVNGYAFVSITNKGFLHVENTIK